jgi:hypothetical protein
MVALLGYLCLDAGLLSDVGFAVILLRFWLEGARRSSCPDACRSKLRLAVESLAAEGGGGQSSAGHCWERSNVRISDPGSVSAGN